LTAYINTFDATMNFVFLMKHSTYFIMCIHAKCPEKSNKAADEGSREQVLRGVAEGTGVV